MADIYFRRDLLMGKNVGNAMSPLALAKYSHLAIPTIRHATHPGPTGIGAATFVNAFPKLFLGHFAPLSSRHCTIVLVTMQAACAPWCRYLWRREGL